MIAFRGAYIQGRFVKGNAKGPFWEKMDPGNTNRMVGRWRSQPEMVEAAIQAAAGAFPKWAAEKPARRRFYLKRLQKSFRQRRRDLAERISAEMGKPLQESLAEVDAAMAKVDITLNLGLKLVASTQKKNPKQFYQYRPRGILAVLGPFNFPLHLPNGNILPALATGNTVVFKPSELTPFTGQLMAECFHEAGLPKGVFNMVQGRGEVGASLAEHPQVNGVLFVGSESVGRAIQKKLLEQPEKICALEMGGKNAAIIFADANPALALRDCLLSALATTGQRCTSLSRLIVHESVAESFTTQLVEGARQWRMGYYQGPASQAGPLASIHARKKFFHFQNQARREGYETLLKARRLKLKTPGFYVSPSIHRLTAPKPKKVKGGYRYEEIFGPDVAIYTFREVEEAVALHNDSRYGLIASVFTRNKSLFNEMLSSLQVGNLNWNRPSIGASSRLPFGGVKASGNHFPAGLFSPYYCTYPMAVQG